jgi:Reverse transcriptase (RNA-dependent DNA polymerase)
LLRVINDLTVAACGKRPSVSLALDISDTFDTIDHDVLCQHACSEFGIQDSAVMWLRSIASGWSNCVCTGSDPSMITASSSGVPQDWLLGPILFFMLTAAVAKMITHHGLAYHM